MSMERVTRLASKSASISGTLNPSKTAHSPGISPPKSKSSMPGKESQEEVLKNIMAELKTLKDSVSHTVKSDDLKSVIACTIKEILSDHKTELVDLLEEKNKKLAEIIETQNDEIKNLKTKIDEITTENTELKSLAESAMSKANWNEQYSRKNNIKLHGVKESSDEDTREIFKAVIKDNIDVEVSDEDILAIHRIPGRRGYQRPILVKFKNNSAKSEVMRHRTALKRKSKNELRLSDDVTQLNSNLINKLTTNARIKSAWYFNGHVYGQVENHRISFDIYDDVESKIEDSLFRR